MNHKAITKILLTALWLLSSVAWASTTWYVNGVSGSDSNTCTSPTTACKTIKHAISLAASGDTIIVAAATYTENLTINISLRIVGSGASTTIIDGGGVGRVVTISSTSAQVVLARMTIRNGHAVYGGGIKNSGTLTLNRSIVSGNTGGDGGGLWNGGTLTVNNSAISSNAASVSCDEGCGAFGAGIYNSAGATLTISNSTIMGNGASVLRCSPSGGCAAGGGGVFNGGRLRISKSTVSRNFSSAPFSITRPSGSAGGGIGNADAMIISNSTLSGNAAIVGAAANGFGGGINNAGTVIISSSTLSGNSAKLGGGIRNYSGSTTLQNSIVASNSAGNCYGTMTSNGYNLSSDGTCPFTNTGDRNNTDPMLGPLQNNGGPTQTMALPSGSPAVDAGNPNGCTDGLGHLLKTDQRGLPRPDTEDAGGCDMGAFERQSD